MLRLEWCMPKIQLHPALSRFVDHHTEVMLDVTAVGEIIPTLCAQFPKLKTAILDTTGHLSPYVNLYINGTSVSELSPHDAVADGDQIDLLTALVGG